MSPDYSHPFSDSFNPGPFQDQPVESTLSAESALEHYLENYRAQSAFVHESSYIDAPSRIGENTTIMHFTHIMAHALIGNHCHIGHNVTIGSGVLVGNHVRVMNNSLLTSGVVIQDDVYCGPCTIFTPLKQVRAETASVSPITPTLIKRNAHIGANTTVASGFTVGEASFIEAGSVIDNHVPDFAAFAGSPMRFIGWRCECGQRLQFKGEQTTRCKPCGKQYQQTSTHKIIQISDLEHRLLDKIS